MKNLISNHLCCIPRNRGTFGQLERYVSVAHDYDSDVRQARNELLVDSDTASYVCIT
jgi:hypothetical protein